MIINKIKLGLLFLFLGSITPQNADSFRALSRFINYNRPALHMIAFTSPKGNPAYKLTLKKLQEKALLEVDHVHSPQGAELFVKLAAARYGITSVNAELYPRNLGSPKDIL